MQFLFGNCGKCRDWTFYFYCMLISHDVFGNVQETRIAGCTVQLETMKTLNQSGGRYGKNGGMTIRSEISQVFILIILLTCCNSVFYLFFFILAIYFLTFFFACFMVCSESFTEFGYPLWTGEGSPQPAKSRAGKIQKGKWTLRCHLFI